MNKLFTMLIMVFSLQLSAQVSIAPGETVYFSSGSIRFPMWTPGPTKLVDGQWKELTKWGFLPSEPRLHPDSLMSTPIQLGESQYLIQYEDLNLYARKIYTIGEATWLSPCKYIELGHSGNTYDVFPIVEMYWELGQLTFAEFCKREQVCQTPIAKQYWETCISFVTFIKNIEK